jgi:DNA-binding SARP family transcriptional activator
MDSDSSLRLFGGWQLWLDGVLATVTTRERRVLSLLALRGERERPSVARTLWPDSDESRAAGNLRAAVWRIQRIRWGLLEEGQGSLRLAEAVRVDVHLLRASAHRLATGYPADVADLDGDELLPGWDDDWVAEERALLHQLRLRALEELALRLLRDADLDGALRAAMRAAAIDPLRESAHRALIAVHLADGNHAEAIRVYRTFQSRLRQELGVCVSRQIVELIRAVHRAGAPHPAL